MNVNAKDIAPDAPYFIYLDHLPDTEQMQVCRSSGNVIVKAGAGSGKTQTLATRYAYLVISKGLRVSEILTLTFTKAAAAEMYSRIYRTLSHFAECIQEDSEENKLYKQRAACAVSEFSDSHIQTLDSYCSEIVRKASNRYGIRPDFSLASSDGERQIKNAALEFVLKHRNNKAILALCKAGELEDLAEHLFAATIIHHTSIISDVTASGEGPFTASLEKQLAYVADIWNKAARQFADARESMADILKENEGKSAAFVQNLKIAFGKQEPDVNVTAANITDTAMPKQMADFVEYAASFNLKKVGIKNEEQKQAIDNVKAALTELSSAQSFVAQYGSIYVPIYKLLDTFLLQVNSQKRISGSLTFKDVGDLALKILREQEDIRRQENSSYAEIMIDEFQDDNNQNRDLLFEVAGLGTDRDNGSVRKAGLFFVGDEKQSIYKFRGADVSAFKNLETTLPDAQLCHISTNYRSSINLLRSFNRLFGGFATSSDVARECGSAKVFPDSVSAEQSFEATFNESARAKSKPGDSDDGTQSAFICLYSEPTEQDDTLLSKEEAEANFIAEQIERLHKEQKAAYKDMAILCKSRTNYTTLARLLLLHGVPYSFDMQQNIFAEAPVNDVYNFIRLCVYPSDTRALTAYLCSPFAGFTPPEAEEILALHAAQQASAFALQKQEQTLGSAGINTEQFLAAKHFYEAMRQDVLTQPLTQTVTRLWYGTGYRYSLYFNKSVRFLPDFVRERYRSSSSPLEEEYEMLFELARKTDADNKNAAWFVDQLNSLKHKTFGDDSADIDVKGIEYRMEARDAVQIMTIHQSKGLQFNYVFVTGCVSKTKERGGKTWVINTKDYGLDCGLAVIYGSKGENIFALTTKERTDAMRDAEFRRLVYVAVTRAIKAVYIVGTRAHATQKGDNHSMLEAICNQYWALSPESGNIFLPLKKEPPFDLVEIQPTERSSLYRGNAARELTPAEYEQLLGNIAAQYAHCQDNTPGAQEIAKLQLSPSSLERLAQESAPAASKGSSGECGYSDIDRIIKHTDTGHSDQDGNPVYKFGYNNFGTLFHSYMQAWANGAEEKFRIDDAVLEKLANEADAQILTTICKKMKDAFLASNCGKEAAEAKNNSREFRSELALKTKIGSYIVNGSVDLLYQNAPGGQYDYTIIDYKTDSCMDKTKYTGQLACYRETVARLLEIQDRNRIRCVLFFARFGKETELSAQELSAFPLGDGTFSAAAGQD